ncbi:DNA-3-methyladenine glycosylase [Chamaesiphon sp. OTE_20_metabat_361]|uniref:DNA-3-methyladenine glycosylase n=1 Tax=Chamaesiphon sp. OTE_20_metabat_361 TaxID=2964689 RepID=UPI00286BA144|nr:DNA-3-methyladenine glycosylase [Chamaesiphon sp. OTE_20_metabat_361]
MEAVIPTAWFDRSALSVAPDLIGCTLVRQLPDGTQLRGIIVETEAYQEGDPACHAYRKQTKRNQIMFGAPGYIYVYLIYGIYHCVNVVTDRIGAPSAVLIRALELTPETLSTILLKPKEKPIKAAAGPGKLCLAMQINLALYGTKLELGSGQAMWIEHRSIDWQAKLDLGTNELTQTTRIGLTQGVDLPWRWYLKGCQAVSKFG